MTAPSQHPQPIENDELIYITPSEYRLLEWVVGKLDEGRYFDALGEIIDGVEKRRFIIKEKITEDNWDPAIHWYCCASSTPAHNDSDVLDTLDEWLDSDDHLSLFKWEVREKIRELRQAGEP